MQKSHSNENFERAFYKKIKNIGFHTTFRSKTTSILKTKLNTMDCLKLYLFFLLIFGCNLELQAQTETPILKSFPSILNTPQHYGMTPPIQKISHKIDHVARYYDYCGPTRETFLYFDSTGLLIARYRGPWVRNADVPPGPTFTDVYTLLNPAPSFFFKYENQSYYYNAKAKKVELLPYKHSCESEGFVAVERLSDHKCAFLNKKAELICPFIYYKLQSFRNGLAIVKTEKGTGVIDTTGRVIIPCIYQDIKVLYSGQIEAQKGYKKFDYFNKKGKRVLFRRGE